MPKISKNDGVPKHIAIIMDGNGRWAKNQNKQRLFGHKAGVEAVRRIIEACIEKQIQYLTLYTFSTENWNRPKKEINGLMSLLFLKIRQELNELTKNGIRLNVIGDVSRLPEKVFKELQKSIEITKNNDKLILNIALSYSSKWEIGNAIKKIALAIQQKKLSIESIDENTLDQFLQTKDIPNPELMIRTGGEKRISNFLLYQLAYSELYFTDVFWPEFDKPHLEDALNFYKSRQRRFGKISEQLTN